MSWFSSRRVRGRRWWLVVALSLGFAGTPAAGLGAASRLTVVPRISGGVLAAYQRLHARGLRVSIPGGLLFDSTAPPEVARAVPRPGHRVSPGSVVRLYLSRRAHRPATPPPRFGSYRVPRFVGEMVSRAYRWVKPRSVAFQAHLGPLRGGTAGTLLANYLVSMQRPTPGRKLTSGARGSADRTKRGVRLISLTVWGAQHGPPQAHTGGAATVGLTTATLAGAVNPRGSLTQYFFSYGPTAAYGSQTPAQPAGAAHSAVPVASTVGNLAPATTYHYQVVATNGAGTSYGADQTVSTSGYYQNPLYAAEFPDPFILDNGSEHSDYWAFATGDLFPILHSTDLVNWASEGTALTTRPSWVASSGDWHSWAPSVAQSPAPCPGSVVGGCYVMYYVGLTPQSVNCIGVATAPSPGGPYTDQGPLDLASSGAGSGTPLGCGDDTARGNIDPSPFIDASGQPYLYVSSDFACTGGTCTLQPTISVIPLSFDLRHAAGSRVPLFSGDAGTWEQADLGTPTVEGPSVTLHNGTYYLFYSGGDWRGPYAMGYATATSPTGPFTKSASNPILVQTPSVLGPGGGDRLVTGPHQGLWMAYAARTSSYSEPRTLRLDPLSWEPSTTAGAPDVPVIHGPSSTPQATQP